MRGALFAEGSGLYLLCGFCPSARTFALGLPPDIPSRVCPCRRLVVIVVHHVDLSGTSTVGRVGRQRVTLIRVLFQRPLSERPVTLSISSRSPVTLSEQSRTLGDSALALRISRTSPIRPAGHLCHFPLCTALPCAPVGRHSHEYYWHSVTLGLASGR